MADAKIDIVGPGEIPLIADLYNQIFRPARDAAFFVAPTPIEEVRAVAAAGESMPPKSTYFFPKVPTGLLFNPLDS